MLRQLYPILLSITIALAIGVYMHPGEARKWIQQAGQWGTEVLDDVARVASALADDRSVPASTAGYASTRPAANPVVIPYPSAQQESNWTYINDSTAPTTSLGAPQAPPTASTGYPSTQPGWPSTPANIPPTSPNSATYPRVLANGGSGAHQPPSGQAAWPTSPSPGAVPPTGNGGSPYVVTGGNPLRSDMPKEAPWASHSANPSAVYPTPPSSNAYQAAEAAPRVGSAYPKVQWAGDWRDYHGVPETVKPANQSQYGYLPPPDADSTAATVNRYLPNQVQTPVQPMTNGSSPYQGQPLPPRQTATAPPAAYPQTPYAAATGPAPPYQASSLPPGQAATPATSPRSQASYPTTTGASVNNQPPTGASSSPYGIRVVQATPFGALKEKAPAQPAAQTEPRVASLPQRSGIPNSRQQTLSNRSAVPPGSQMKSPDPVADLTLCESAQILARVGSELILADDVLPIAYQMLSGVDGIDKASDEELATAREQLVRKILPQHIELKLLYVDAKRNLPPEAIENINKQLTKRFEEVEVSERMKEMKVNSRRELEEKLAGWGTSLEHEKQTFIEKAIAQQWVLEKIRKEEEITHEELLDYYYAHATEYDHPTRVRWEQLEVTFDRHTNKQEAWQLIATMGNAVQQGSPLAQVAKDRSEGVMAAEGGQRDWLTEGSLKSDVLDRALFSLPVGTLSPILEDETGFHIVRVVQREDAYRTPFEDIQGEIREKLKEEHKQARLKDFVNELREEIPVWTIFDKQVADSSGAKAGTRF